MPAGGMREMWVVSLAAVAIAADRLDLRIDPLAVLVLRGDDDRAGGANHGHSVLFHRPIDAELEDIVADHLRIVAGKVPIDDAFKLILHHPLVRLHREMAAKAARRPGRMADLAV